MKGLFKYAIQMLWIILPGILLAACRPDKTFTNPTMTALRLSSTPTLTAIANTPTATAIPIPDSTHALPLTFQTTPERLPGKSIAPPPEDESVHPKPKTITLANHDSIINLKIGDRFVLMLGSELDWSVTSSDPAVITRIKNILTIRDAQGVYQAQQAGNASLNASGEPVCRQQQPACVLPGRTFQIKIVVH
jgi:hypothetical protein